MGEELYVRERRLPYGTLDADNRMYENRDASTKYLADPLASSETVAGMPAEDQGLIMGGSVAEALVVGPYAA